MSLVAVSDPYKFGMQSTAPSGGDRDDHNKLHDFLTFGSNVLNNILQYKVIRDQQRYGQAYTTPIQTGVGTVAFGQSPEQAARAEGISMTVLVGIAILVVVLLLKR